jgi:hypothetical protein
MSVLIRGMEMPKNCMSCPFPAVGVDAYYCHCPTQDGKEYDFKYADTIPDTCPLVEIPTPHGRMIAEKTITEIRYHDADGYHIVNGEQLCELEIDAETVIEPEGSEE